MTKLAVLDKTGKKVSDIKLNEAVFAIEPSQSAMHLMVVNYLANQRQGTQSTLTRSEVSGGGKNRGVRKEPVAQDRVPPERPSGRTAVSRSARSPAITALTSTRRSKDLL